MSRSSAAGYGVTVRSECGVKNGPVVAMPSIKTQLSDEERVRTTMEIDSVSHALTYKIQKSGECVKVQVFV